MKTLFLLRHAKSGDDGMVARDFDRPLNAKGRRAAAAIGRRMRDAGLGFDAVLASPAVRVRETLEEAARGYGAPIAPRFDQRLYLASADDLLDAVRAVPDAAGRVLVAGHNPGLALLVLALVPEGDRTRDEVEEKYPTAGLAEIALDVSRWTEAADGCGRLVRFVRPRDLDPALGPERA